MKKRNLVVLGLLSLLVAGGVFGLRGAKEIAVGEAAMAEFRIEKLSCGSCVDNIQSALAQLDGVGAVDVNLTSNRGQVTFDPRVTDSGTIAAAISAAGYPARLRTELSPEEFADLQQDQVRLGQQYLARIGERLLARSTFAALVEQRGKDAAPGQVSALKRALWNELLQRELLLDAAERNAVTVQDGEVDLRIEELGRQHKGLEAMFAENYPDLKPLRDQLREEMIIGRLLETHVFDAQEPPQEKQRRFQQWFAEVQRDTEVVIFDPEIKALTSGSSGCGGSCCG